MSDGDKKKLQSTKDFSSYDKLYENWGNINIALEDDLPTPQYEMYPIVFEHNWDYKDFVSRKIFTDDECDIIISKWDEKNVDEEKLNYRKCGINWIHYYQPGWEWVFDKLLPIIKEVNDNVYKFELSNPITQEPVQFTKYPKGGYYKKHTDWEGGGNLDVRKLSWVINLSDPKKYRGGNLEIRNKKVIKDRGMIHLFPSFLMHQATQVFTGNRYSLVGWTPGPTFK